MKRWGWIALGLVLVAGGVAGALRLLEEGRGTLSALDGVPPEAAAAVWAHDLQGLAADLDAWEGPSRGRLSGLRGQLSRGLGFDPSDPEALEARGLDATRGLAAYLDLEGGGTVAVLPVADLGAFEAALEALAEARLGPMERGEHAGARGPVHTLRPAGGGAPLAWAHDAGLAWVSSGDRGAERVERGLSAPRGSFRLRAGGQGRLERVAPGHRLGGMIDPRAMTFHPGGASLELVESLWLGLGRVGEADLKLTIYARLSPQGRVAADLFRGSLDGAAPPQLRGDALAAARAQVEAKALWNLLKRAGLPGGAEALSAHLIARGLKPEALVAQLAGPATAQAWLLPPIAPADGAPAAGAPAPTLPPSPMSRLGWTVTVPLREGEGWAAQAEPLTEALAAAGNARRTPLGPTRWRFDPAYGPSSVLELQEAAWVVASSEAALDAPPPPQGTPTSPLVDQLAGQGAVAGAIDLVAIERSVMGLGPSDLGGGPGGMMLLATVRGVARQLSGLEALTLSLDRQGDGLVFDATLSARPADPRPAEAGE